MKFCFENRFQSRAVPSPVFDRNFSPEFRAEDSPALKALAFLRQLPTPSANAPYPHNKRATADRAIFPFPTFEIQFNPPGMMDIRLRS